MSRLSSKKRPRTSPSKRSRTPTKPAKQTAAATTATTVALIAMTVVIGAGTGTEIVIIIVSQMETGAGAVIETIVQEMEAVLDRAKVLTQTKMIGIGAVARVTATVVVVVAIVVITTVAVIAPVLARPAATVVVTIDIVTAEIGQGTIALAKMIAAMIVVAAALPRLQLPTLVRMIATTELSLCNRFLSVLKQLICASFSKKQATLSKPKL